MPTSKKNRKTVGFDPRKLLKAKRILGAKTEAEAIDRALDVVIKNEQLNKANIEFAGSKVTINDVFGRLNQ